MSNLYLGLVHHPVYNKQKEVVTTSVTNLDIHDIARSCKTFNVKRYFIITPIELQQDLVGRILGHWKTNKSLVYNPDRQDALSVAVVASSVENAIQEIEKIEKRRPIVAVTGAQFKDTHGSTLDLQNLRKKDKSPCLLLFGTGWGLAQEVLDLADFRLNPILGSNPDGYNHLSVRSAVAIYLSEM